MRRVASLLIVLVAAGCGLPRDADGTLERVRGGTLRVAALPNPPWVVDAGDGMFRGVEPDLVARIATAHGARVQWVRMPEFEAVRALHDRHLDLLIGGFDRTVAWNAEVALTRPYLTTSDGKAHVLAAPPGENAWLVHVERELHTSKDAVRSALASAAR